MRICQYCGALKRRDDPVLECWVNGERYLLHRGCQDDWRKAMDDSALPANSKVLGKVPELHHKHYHSLGNEQPEDVELLCPKRHKGADEERAAKSRA